MALAVRAECHHVRALSAQNQAHDRTVKHSTLRRVRVCAYIARVRYHVAALAIELLVPDDIDEVGKAIIQAARTGEIGDGPVLSYRCTSGIGVAPGERDP